MWYEPVRKVLWYMNQKKLCVTWTDEKYVAKTEKDMRNLNINMLYKNLVSKSFT